MQNVFRFIEQRSGTAAEEAKGTKERIGRPEGDDGGFGRQRA